MATMQQEPSVEEIARRAYEIWESEQGRSDEENWARAEQELREAFGAPPAARRRRAAAKTSGSAGKTARLRKRKQDDEAVE